jgi:hypothetical protein
VYKQILTAFSGLAILAVPGIVCADTIFCGDCASAYVRGHWQSVQQVAPGRISVESDPLGARGLVTKVQVFPGDKFLTSSGERAEKATMLGQFGQAMQVLPTSGHEFYAVSVRLDPNWKAPDYDPVNGTWGTIFQLHGPDSYMKPPAISLRIEDRFHLQMFSGDVSDSTKKNTNYEFTDGSLKAGTWIDFVIEVQWSTKADGMVAIYRRDQGSTAWQQIFYKNAMTNLQYSGTNPVGAHYWKTGFYRNPSTTTHTLWLGAVARATTRAEAEAGAFTPHY